MYRKVGRSAALTTVLSLGLSGCWEQARFDGAQSNWNRDETTITTDNVDDLTELWSRHLSFGEPQSPLSRNGVIYVYSDEAKTASRAAFDAATGAVLWQRTDPEQANEHSLTDPVWIDDRIVVGWGDGRLGGTRAYDPATGSEVASDGQAHTWGLAQQDGQLALGAFTYFAGEPFIWISGLSWRCVVRLTGQGGSVGGTDHMAFVGDSLMWGDGNHASGYVGCPEEGGEWASTWSADLGAPVGPIVGIGTTHAAYLTGTSDLTVLDAATGAVAWTTTGVSGPPAVADGELIVPFSDGRVAALDALTGTLLWESPSGAATGVPMVAGDVVYLPDGDAVVAFALDGCGSPVCDPIASTTHVGDTIQTTIVDDGRLIAITSGGRIAVFGLAEE